MKHPHLPTIHAWGVAQDEPYIDMEYVNGENLREHVKKRGEVPVEEAVGWALTAAQVLQHVHERGVIHRDVKPENLVLRANRAW